ncbi:TetR/AcrR family transcriptional regulator [Cryptosporangium aurantiacum]|uniref:Transcriptional regulator, TetR family n=1 Tax=Cryptosporangium aurantiacum TaxID=134849 RepID=A0A1M7RLP3_9ACTN|nr:TetR/AcrR family transcriptional regulator [Cryptosporangium aurantiacum]SHN47174.1 transcriptional regulator, TetR family [Cryptosporangium aurantiacum]
MTSIDQSQDRRRRLLTAARTLFAARPYEKVTTTEIAKRAGVAYGLIAHHFENKHGLYLAVMKEIGAELAAEQDAPLTGDTLEDQLREALGRHVRYIDQNAAGFTAMMRGGLGTDPEFRSMLETLRWVGAARILHRLGVPDPPPATLRSAMRAWVAYFDELMLDRIETQALDLGDLVELAAAALKSTVAATLELDPEIRVRSDVHQLLHSRPATGSRLPARS